ncbi:DUF1617 family protein [Alkalibacillus almallahensis]|uniref:DUF1617 family protein n=1 Tax=Alkalibacillus almallahensis TaxID=1379154 RepID=UPI00141DA5F8|nr:DUF1617 family protein [Alkalibacillus almallahensis]NIK11200.1 putative RNase H-like nuclease (RuvC/YqgF family) [Alkalibacillus almallahensis]
MQVKIKNATLGQAIDLLFNLSLRGKESRHRTKFIKKLGERVKEVEEQRKQLAKEHSHLDDEGNPIMKEDGKKYDIKDFDAFQKDIDELYNEEMVIDGGDNQDMLKTVKKVLEECNVAFSGNEAVIYDYLCDQFEEAENHD